jgi:hypothetical protein
MSQGRYVSGELVRSVFVVNMTSGGGGGGGDVDSVFGRTGAVVAASGDYEEFYLKKNTNGQTQTISGSGLLVTDGALNVTGVLTVANDILPAVSGGSNLGSATFPFGSGYFSSGSLFIGDAHITATGTSAYLNGSIMATGESIASGAIPPANALRQPVWTTLNQPAAVNQGSAWLSQGNSLDATYPGIAYYAYDYEAVTGGPASSGAYSEISNNGAWGGIENNVGTYTLKVRAAWPFGVSDEQTLNITVNPFTLSRDTMFGELDGLQARIEPTFGSQATDAIVFPGAVVTSGGDYFYDADGSIESEAANYGIIYSTSLDIAVGFRLAGNGDVNSTRRWDPAPAFVQGTDWGAGSFYGLSSYSALETAASESRVRDKGLPLVYYNAGIGSQHYLQLTETTSGVFNNFGCIDTDWSYGFQLFDDWVANGYCNQMLSPSGSSVAAYQAIGAYGIGDSPSERYVAGNTNNYASQSLSDFDISTREWLIASSGDLITVTYDGSSTRNWKLYVNNEVLVTQTDTFFEIPDSFPTSPQTIPTLEMGNFVINTTQVTGYMPNEDDPAAWPFRLSYLFVANGTAFTASEISGLVTNKDDLTAAPDYGDIDVLGTFTSTGITNTKGSTTTYERKDFSFS